MDSWAGASADRHQSVFDSRQLPSGTAPLERIRSKARTILEVGCRIGAVDTVANHAQRQDQLLKPNGTLLACIPNVQH